jgi:DNA-binding CsgD family transcriptional regulator
MLIGAAAITLSAQQAAALGLAASGFATSEVAILLRLSVDEARGLLAGCVGLLGAGSKLDAVVIALRLGLVRLPSAAQREILSRLVESTILVGSIETLGHTLAVSMADLRTALCELLETERIAVHSAPGGQLTIRLERRASRALPALPPAIERRRASPDIWIL